MRGRPFRRSVEEFLDLVQRRRLEIAAVPRDAKYIAPGGEIMQRDAKLSA